MLHDWLQEAVFPTRSVSNDLLIIACGNIIHKYCTITILGELADCWDIINLTDKNGKSNWPTKNTPEAIHRMFYNSKGKRKMSEKAKQKEYYNNPTAEGDTFKQFIYGKCPPLKKCEKIVTYIDPSPSNNKEKNSSSKAVVIVGLYENRYYVYRVWLGKATNSEMVGWIGQAYYYLDKKGIDTKKMFIENNTLQDPHYQQVVKPLLEKYRKEHGVKLPVREDRRKKADKYERLENMADDNNDGNIIFNEEEKDNPMMVEMEAQWLAVSKDSKEMDGPDAVEGAKTMIDTRVVKEDIRGKQSVFRGIFLLFGSGCGVVVLAGFWVSGGVFFLGINKPQNTCFRAVISSICSLLAVYFSVSTKRLVYLQ